MIFLGAMEEKCTIRWRTTVQFHYTKWWIIAEMNQMQYMYLKS